MIEASALQDIRALHVQRAIAAAASDNAHAGNTSVGSTRALAGLGHHGVHTGNCERDLNNYFNKHNLYELDCFDTYCFVIYVLILLTIYFIIHNINIYIMKG